MAMLSELLKERVRVHDTDSGCHTWHVEGDMTDECEAKQFMYSMLSQHKFRPVLENFEALCGDKMMIDARKVRGCSGSTTPAKPLN